jgi:hypothetical protein
MGLRKKPKEPPVIVKKVKAYPITTLIVRADGTPPLRAAILRLNTVGLQLESSQLILKVGEDVKVSFTIPLHGNDVEELMRVIKTTDSYKDLNTGEKIYITELHFKNLNAKHLNFIREFMFAIKQKN